MSDPIPSRPQLLQGTTENPPIWARESTWAGVVKLLTDWGALAAFLGGIYTQDARLLVAAAVLKTLASNVGVIQSWCVRAGVSRASETVETLAARTETELKKPLDPKVLMGKMSSDDLNLPLQRKP